LLGAELLRKKKVFHKKYSSVLVAVMYELWVIHTYTCHCSGAYSHQLHEQKPLGQQ